MQVEGIGVLLCVGYFGYLMDGDNLVFLLFFRMVEDDLGRRLGKAIYRPTSQISIKV